MPEIIGKYYAGRGPEAEDVIARAKKAWNDVQAARQSLMEEYGANGILPGDKKLYTVAGLLFYEKPEFNFMTYAEATQKTADGKSCTGDDGSECLRQTGLEDDVCPDFVGVVAKKDATDIGHGNPDGADEHVDNHQDDNRSDENEKPREPHLLL